MKLSLAKKGLLLTFFLSVISCVNTEDNIIGDFSSHLIPGNGFHNMLYQQQFIFSNKGVKAFGNNNDFIILKTCAIKDNHLNRDSVFYYIIDIHGYAKDPNQEKSKALYGPLNENEFSLKKKQLGINSMIFKEEYNDN